MTRAHALFFAVVFILAFSFPVTAQTVSRKQLLKEIEAKRQELEAKRQELAALEQQYLSPSDDDRLAFAHFLSQPDTGMIRLLPREKYDSEVYRIKQLLAMRGGGAYYSFTRRTHEYGFGSDIQLESGQLSVGFAGADYGMLLKLDGASFEAISAEHPAINTLIEYKRAKSEPEARVEYRRFSKGAELSGFVYKNRLPVEQNATYLLRAINYRESDVVVVFQVVRQDSDGSVVIGWKILKKFSKPQLDQNATASNSTNN